MSAMITTSIQRTEPNGKVDEIPVEADTKILFQTETRVGDYDALHQKWFWEGIGTESLIFPAHEVRTLDDSA